MAISLDVLRTYNCRITGAGVIKRGRVLDDWLRYGVYYGTPEYLKIHDFSNWNVLIFDYDVIAQGVDPADYGDTDIYVYMAFGSRYSTAAHEGGYLPPEGNAAELATLRENFHREIDVIIDAGFAGVFFDECDTGYWDWSYCLESSEILKTQLQEYCTYIAGRGGKSFINGCPWYAECGDNFLLESFLASWKNNLFTPDYLHNDFFIKYPFALDDSGEAGGIPWTTGIYSWLYCKQYAPDVDIFAHSYGAPESIWQHDKQLYSLSGALAMGLQSWNYIEPTNQTLVPIWAHSFYVGAPLECPQFDIPNRKITRKYTGASVEFTEDNATGIIDMNVEPDYWWNVDQDFEDINWEVDGTQVSGENKANGFIPDYIKIENIYTYDDRNEIYFRLKMLDSFLEADLTPLFFYIQLDNNAPGWTTGRSIIDDVPYLHFNDLKCQIYLYGRSIFYWNTDINDWKYLYPAKYKVSGNYIYYAIRKETLKFAVSSWDEETIDFIPFFLYDAGNSYYTDHDDSDYPGCLPHPDTMDYDAEYKYVEWIELPEGKDMPDWAEDLGMSEVEERPYPDCDVPDLNSADDTDYNQITTETYLDRVICATYTDPVWKKDKWGIPYLTYESSYAYHSAYNCVYDFTVYGYCKYTLQKQNDVYAPHSAVIYSVTGQINKKVSQVSITGNFDKAWVFDRENGQFVGPDDTPDTHFTSSPFSPTKIIDGQDIYIAIAHDDTDMTADTWNVSGVDVILVDWASTHSKGYDIALPDLIEWQSVYEQWKEAIVPETIERTYLPAGVKRGGINVKKDNIKGTFIVSVPSSSAIVTALETYDITNATLVMRRTYDDLDLSDPDNTELLVKAYVDSWELTDTELRIRATLNFHNWGGAYPKRRVSYFCPFVFKGPQCGYGGAATACDKTLTTCKSLNNESNFGGIPTIPRLQRGKWG